MASEEHLRLSTFIKSTHERLRKECGIYGPEVAWERHVARNDLLQVYSDSMQQLATQHWSQRLSSKSDSECRIEWIKKRYTEYFFGEGFEKYSLKEEEILRKMSKPSGMIPKRPEKGNEGISILDVGSCYNPLRVEPNIQVTAIDLFPSRGNEVYKCDFLRVEIGSKEEREGDEIRRLQEESFDVIAFSLFLEYLPCPKQRFQCCEKALKLLRPGGLLLVVTPDSKHCGANCEYMKSWRFHLSRIGFARIKYEKLKHLHCVAFRRAFEPEVALRWVELNSEKLGKGAEPQLFRTDGRIFIPQDFSRVEKKDNEKLEKQSFREDRDDDEFVQGFEELPFR